MEGRVEDVLGHLEGESAPESPTKTVQTIEGRAFVVVVEHPKVHVEVGLRHLECEMLLLLELASPA